MKTLTTLITTIILGISLMGCGDFNENLNDSPVRVAPATITEMSQTMEKPIDPIVNRIKETNHGTYSTWFDTKLNCSCFLATGSDTCVPTTFIYKVEDPKYGTLLTLDTRLGDKDGWKQERCGILREISGSTWKDTFLTWERTDEEPYQDVSRIIREVKEINPSELAKVVY